MNLSPKGLPSATFSIFDPNHAAYVDGTGSGSETISHLYENGRITIMFCSFTKSPRIMRFFCTGKVVEWDSPGFEPLLRKMGKEAIKGARAVISLDVWKVTMFIPSHRKARLPTAYVGTNILWVRGSFLGHSSPIR